ncbi:uncharacterized protein LOC128956825 [Oppia nitens]|uniref:uncharacterized protein LOC128956825 n=1 Tax=Oppia nitens TaxID=1686743 RepID=UPI0023DB238F|nr:uncharacterized protein LOC128956825 [Oppia nitens]
MSNLVQTTTTFDPIICESLPKLTNNKIRQQISNISPDIQKIIKYVVNGPDSGVTYDELAKFVDQFGPRFTGTASLESSIDYMVDRLKRERHDKVYTENVTVPVWIRGKEWAQMVSPHIKQLNILGLGSSVGTNGQVLTGNVIVVKTFDELKRRSHEVRGKFVVYNYDFVSYRVSVEYREHGASRAAQFGAIGVFIRSVTPFSIYSPHTGAQTFDNNNNVRKIPAVSITVEDSELFGRLAGRGINITVSLSMEAHMNGVAVSRNTISEITGSNKPDELVLVSGHLDSWDVGQGAMDDGGGAFISWRALSVIKKLGLRPKRTVRSVLWTDEETDYSGVKQYIQIDFLVGKGVPGGSLDTRNQKYFYFHHTDGDTMTVQNRRDLDLCTAVWASIAYGLASIDDQLPRYGVTYDELSKFVDLFGPRFTGTASLESSIDYMVDRLKRERHDKVYTENVTVPVWIRGKEWAQMVSPRIKQLNILGLGTSVGTNGSVLTGNVIVVKTFDELKRRSHEVRGKFVVYNNDFVSYGVSVQYREQGASRAAQFGAIGVLIRSVTPFSIYSPHTGQQTYANNNIRKIPAVSITVEDAELFGRLAGRGINITVSLSMEAHMNGVGVSRNTISEIIGPTKPDEVVLVSGHLDSWDVGQGAMDNGGGAFIAWRALSVIKKLGLQPKRTVRSVLWTGEEMGLIGAQQYTQKHINELNKISIAMESDMGTFRPTGISYWGQNPTAQCIVNELLKTLKPINATQLSVPGGSLDTRNQKYFYFHHTDGDTMTVQNRRDLDLCTAVWASIAYGLASIDDQLPRYGVTYDELSKFVDLFGPRFTGTASLESSIDYMVDRLKRERHDKVYTENVTVPVWIRGKEWAQMVSPRIKQLNILGLGTSVGTNGSVLTGNVIVVKTFDELKRRSHEVRGKFVVYNNDFVSYGVSVQYREQGASRAAQFGAIGVLIRSVTPFSIYSPHTGQQTYANNNIRKIPAVSITVEDAELFGRLAGRGINITVSLSMEAHMNGVGVSRNTISEIIGPTKPDEVVLVSGHLDSWDVGQGAMDNGGGAFIAWRALSVIKKLGLQPKRTVRSVLWTGEEMGLIGAQQYTQKHINELNKISIAMESDMGTFRPTGISYWGQNPTAQCIVNELLKTLKPINATQLSVPGGSLDTRNQKYFYFHHTDGDTMTVQNRRDLDLCTAVWASIAYGLASIDDQLPR